MRLGKVLLVLGMGLFLALAAINNITMSAGGYGAVAAAVGMETTFQAPGAMWRAVESPAIIWLGLAAIVIAELAGAIYCLWGAAKMWRARSATDAFNASKTTALIGLTITACLYLIGFQAIAQEWFMMWQSTEMNVLQEAFRNFASAMLLMIWVNTDDR